MINSIKIERYRILDGLSIESFSKVNLITGKNNTGKSTLLEAIALYSTKCDLSVILQLLEERGENYRQVPNNKNATETNVKALSSFFANRIVGFGQNNAIKIGTIENTLFGKQETTEKSISLRFVKYFDEITSQSEEPVNRRKRTIIDIDDDKQIVDYKLGLEIRVGLNSFILPLDDERFYNRIGFRGFGSIENFQFIRTRNIDREINGKLWDNITLTPKEQYVIDALRIIEPDIERVAFVEEGTRNRYAVAKRSSNNNVEPLRSMGDGINRILTMILALVNSDNGFLLIDEFENGLHYSIQEKLWEIIFNLANKLNVQVFVTTHSEDCISGFENILNGPQNNLDGKLIRLDNINGKIKQVVFSKEELKVATDQNIETR
ncbi:MAG: ATP-binding protein [Chitinophagaceae bacterium]|nr:ATP-binding protein [Chitinophagaceae bacterium]